VAGMGAKTNACKVFRIKNSIKGNLQDPGVNGRIILNLEKMNGWV